MSGPRLSDLRALDGRRVRLVVPKPREDQRLTGVLAVEPDGVRLRIDDGDDPERFRTVRVSEREGDGVLRAFRADGTLIGRVNDVEPVAAE